MAGMVSALSLIGVPPTSAPAIVARMGPEALRIADLHEALANRGIAARDLGNLNGPRNPW